MESGKPFKLITVWNGRPRQPGIHGVRSGSYTIYVDYANDIGWTSFTIGCQGRSAAGRRGDQRVPPPVSSSTSRSAW
jgi:hypothetical protein